jgi:hypothetical protein
MSLSEQVKAYRVCKNSLAEEIAALEKSVCMTLSQTSEIFSFQKGSMSDYAFQRAKTEMQNDGLRLLLSEDETVDLTYNVKLNGFVVSETDTSLYVVKNKEVKKSSPLYLYLSWLKKGVDKEDWVSLEAKRRETPLPSPGNVSTQGLRYSQGQAYRHVAGTARFHAIWGPAGTGKSHTIAHCANNMKHKFLVVATANKAVDCLVGKISDCQRFGSRYGKKSGDPYLASRLFAEAKDSAKSRKDQLMGQCKSSLAEAKAVLTSLTQATVSAINNGVIPTNFDVVVVDEASMVPDYLLEILINLYSGKLILVGDPRQLPPVSETPSQNAYKRLNISRPGIDKDVTFLDEQSRMPEGLASLVSANAYDNKLKTTDRNDKIFGFHPHQADAKDHVELMAQEVSAAINSGVALSEILVLARFNSTVKALKSAMPIGVLCVTVHKAQGSEAAYVFYTPVNTSGRQSRDSAFGFDIAQSLALVAATRAQKELHAWADNGDWHICRLLNENSLKMSAPLKVEQPEKNEPQVEQPELMLTLQKLVTEMEWVKEELAEAKREIKLLKAQTRSKTQELKVERPTTPAPVTPTERPNWSFQRRTSAFSRR